jgi:hypothetical protein
MNPTGQMQVAGSTEQLTLQESSLNSLPSELNYFRYSHNPQSKKFKRRPVTPTLSENV